MSVVKLSMFLLFFATSACTLEDWDKRQYSDGKIENIVQVRVHGYIYPLDYRTSRRDYSVLVESQNNQLEWKNLYQVGDINIVANVPPEQKMWVDVTSKKIVINDAGRKAFVNNFTIHVHSVNDIR